MKQREKRLETMAARQHAAALDVRDTDTDITPSWRRATAEDRPDPSYLRPRSTQRDDRQRWEGIPGPGGGRGGNSVAHA
jgi:hypothetical protein